MKHFFTTCMVVLGAIVVIALRFECATSQNTIDRLNRQINVMSTEKQKERSRYMTLTRESAMLHLVDSLRLGLTIPDRPSRNRREYKITHFNPYNRWQRRTPQKRKRPARPTSA